MLTKAHLLEIDKYDDPLKLWLKQCPQRRCEIHANLMDCVL